METKDGALPLEILARQIEDHAKKSDDHILKAANLIAEARQRIDAGEIQGMTWSAWADLNLTLSASRIKELLKIGQADDPAAALARQREATRTRVASHRKRQAKETAEAASVAESSSTAAESGGDQGVDETDFALSKLPRASEPGTTVPQTTRLPASATTAVQGRDDLEPERSDLIAWAETAPIEIVREAYDLIVTEFGLSPAAGTERPAA